MTRTKINSVAFDKYKGLYSLIEKWDSLSDNLVMKAKEVPIILPDIFLISKSGTGRTEFVKYLADYLREKNNLMDFYGNVNWFEFRLGYCEPRTPFVEIQRFMNEVENAAGFRNEYRGIIFIDVDEWKRHYEEKYFIDFLEYLSDNSDNWLIIISVSEEDDKNITEMGIVVSCYLRLETIEILPPTIDELLVFANNVLESYGIKLSEDAEKIVGETIETLCQNKHFDWYKTAKMLCQNIAYSCFSKGKNAKFSLDAEDLLMFGKHSDYVAKETKKREKIGF